MRRIAHLSDLHFGRVDATLLAPLRRRVQALEPDVVVVSGDLTQRAKPHEFREARDFLETLPSPQIVVPGNHDVPLYNPFQRFFTPLAKFRRFISHDVEPVYVDDKIAVVGVNTARSLVFKGGRINEKQIDAVRAKLCNLPEDIVKIVVTHHPFDIPEEGDTSDIVGRARLAIRKLAVCGADIFLAGHAHVSHAGNTDERYAMDDFAALIVQAGTATSTRGRGEANAFNALSVANEEVRVERYAWEEAIEEFALSSCVVFHRHGNRWARAASTEMNGSQGA